METLKFLLQGKKADRHRSKDVVSEAASWMSTQFQNAGITADYIESGANFGFYGHFVVKSELKDPAITLHVKIAEINGAPYVDAEVRGVHKEVLFPYFGELTTEENRSTLLHFIADFKLSTTPTIANPSK